MNNHIEGEGMPEAGAENETMSVLQQSEKIITELNDLMAKAEETDPGMVGEIKKMLDAATKIREKELETRANKAEIANIARLMLEEGKGTRYEEKLKKIVELSEQL